MEWNEINPCDFTHTCAQTYIIMKIEYNQFLYLICHQIQRTWKQSSSSSSSYDQSFPRMILSNIFPCNMCLLILFSFYYFFLLLWQQQQQLVFDNMEIIIRNLLNLQIIFMMMMLLMKTTHTHTHTQYVYGSYVKNILIFSLQKIFLWRWWWWSNESEWKRLSFIHSL